MNPIVCLPLSLVALVLSGCAPAPSQPEQAPAPVEAPKESVPVNGIELAVGGELQAEGLTLTLRLGRRITRRDGSHKQEVVLRAEGEELAGDTDAFVDEVLAGGKLVSVQGWAGERLQVSVETAPMTPALEEDQAAELAAAQAQSMGYDVDAHEVSYELTRGEGALVYTLHTDDRLQVTILVGLHSGKVLETSEEQP